MRFDIGPGGAFVILAGLAGLSGAVFALGLIAGNELQLPHQDSATQAEVKVVAVPPPAPPAAAAATPGVVAVSSEPDNGAPAIPPPSEELGKNVEKADNGEDAAAIPPPPAMPPPLPAPEPDTESAPDTLAPPKAPVKVSNVSTAKSDKKHRTLADAIREIQARTRADANSANASANADDDSADDEAPASRPAMVASTPGAPAVKPGRYSVQVDAVMDKQGAAEMVDKLRRRGYQPYIVEANIAGQTWYRVRIGRYATEADAQAAEAKLRQQFAGAFSTR